MSEEKSPVAIFFLWLNKFSDGKKTLSGIILIAGGVGTIFLTPDYRDEGVNLVAIGIPLLITGITHKVVKSNS